MTIILNWINCTFLSQCSNSSLVQLAFPNFPKFHASRACLKKGGGRGLPFVPNSLCEYSIKFASAEKSGSFGSCPATNLSHSCTVGRMRRGGGGLRFSALPSFPSSSLNWPLSLNRWIVASVTFASPFHYSSRKNIRDSHALVVMGFELGKFAEIP